MYEDNGVFVDVSAFHRRAVFMKKLQNFYGVASVMLIVVAVVGCNLLDKESNTPTMPESSGQLPVVGLPGQIANFYVSSGITDHFGVYKGDGFFTANVPKKGVFLFTYFTEFGGPFYLVTKVKKNSLLFVGLQLGDEVLDVTLSEGNETALALTSPEAEDFGSVVVLYRPGRIGTWSNFIIINPEIVIIVLIRGGVIIVSDTVVILSPEGWRTKKTKKTRTRRTKTKKAAY